jgi:hypothetical protein
MAAEKPIRGGDRVEWMVRTEDKVGRRDEGEDIKDYLRWERVEARHGHRGARGQSSSWGRAVSLSRLRTTGMVPIRFPMSELIGIKVR